MAGLNDELELGGYTEPTPEELEKQRQRDKEWRELCAKNKKEMTTEEYQAWIDFSD